MSPIISALIQFVSLMFAGVTVFVSYKTLKHQREHNTKSIRHQIEHDIKSVKPFINVDSHLTPEEHLYRVRLENHGLGPAFLEKIQIFFNGNDFPSFDQMFETSPLIKSERSQFRKEWSHVIFHDGPAGHWLKASGEMNLLLYNGDFTRIYGTLKGTIPGCQVDITYSDIYGNKFFASEVI